MAFKAFGKTIRKEDYTTIRKMARIVTQEPIDIYDLRSNRMQVSPDDIVFLFGHAAELEGTNKDCKAKLSFPEVEKMSTDLGETEVRQHAYQRLLKLKEILEGGIEDNQSLKEKITFTITEDDMPDITQLSQLEKCINAKNILHWEGITKSGRTIRLTTEPKESAADVNMTFAEFYNLRKFMEVFGLKETNIVYKPSTSREVNSN